MIRQTAPTYFCDHIIGCLTAINWTEATVSFYWNTFEALKIRGRGKNSLGLKGSNRKMDSLLEHYLYEQNYLQILKENAIAKILEARE